MWADDKYSTQHTHRVENEKQLRRFGRLIKLVPRIHAGPTHIHTCVYTLKKFRQIFGQRYVETYPLTRVIMQDVTNTGLCTKTRWNFSAKAIPTMTQIAVG